MNIAFAFKTTGKRQYEATASFEDTAFNGATRKAIGTGSSEAVAGSRAVQALITALVASGDIAPFKSVASAVPATPIVFRITAGAHKYETCTLCATDETPDGEILHLVQYEDGTRGQEKDRFVTRIKG